MIQVNSSYCKIPGGKVEFRLDNESKLTVKISVLFENCHCNFEKTINDTISNLEVILKKDPLTLYNKIIQDKHIPEPFLEFLARTESPKTSESITSSDSKSSSPRNIVKSPSFEISQGKGYFELNEDQTVVLKTNFNLDGCKYNFEKSFSTTTINLDTLKDDPSSLFESLNFSKEFDPFFKKPNTKAAESLCKVYFGMDRLPKLHPEIAKIWNMISPLTGKRFCDSHTLFYVLENNIISFAKAVEKKEIVISTYSSPRNYTSTVKEGPYWALITNERVEGPSGKTFEEEVKLLKDKCGQFQYEPSNLIEACLHRIWHYVNKTPLNSNFWVRCTEMENNKHMVVNKGNEEYEVQIKPGAEKNFRDKILGVIRFYT